MNREQLIKEALESHLLSNKRLYNDLERSYTNKLYNNEDKMIEKMESKKVKIEQLETLLKEFS